MVGQIVTLTATVTVLALASGVSSASAAKAATAVAAIPTGSVTFSDGATVLGTVPLNASGVATFTAATLAYGGHTLTARYSGDASAAVVIITAVQRVEPTAEPALPVPISGWLVLLMAALLAVMGVVVFGSRRTA